MAGRRTLFVVTKLVLQEVVRLALEHCAEPIKCAKSDHIHLITKKPSGHAGRQLSCLLQLVGGRDAALLCHLPDPRRNHVPDNTPALHSKEIFLPIGILLLTVITGDSNMVSVR